jgi:hypothetical protein
MDCSAAMADPTQPNAWIARHPAMNNLPVSYPLFSTLVFYAVYLRMSRTAAKTPIGVVGGSRLVAPGAAAMNTDLPAGMCAQTPA